MDVIIGVDGGGSKTEVIAYNLLGSELFKSVSGYGNVLINKEQAIKNIIDGINRCLVGVRENFKDINCIFIYAGLAGIEVGNNVYVVENELKSYFNTNVKVVNDAIIAHAALLKGNDGILTISGTGSISIGIKNGTIKRAGGWGHLIGDEGSGYYISLQAIKKLVNEEDMGYPKSLLSKAIMNYLKIKSAEEIKDFVYNSSKDTIAKLAPLVVEYSEYDNYSKEILINAAKQLVNLTLMVTKKLDFDENVKIGIKGSVLTKVNTIKQIFEKELENKLRKVEIISNEVPSAKGGFYLALSSLNLK